MRMAEKANDPEREITSLKQMQKHLVTHVTQERAKAVVLSLPDAVTLYTVPHVIVTPTIASLSLLFHSCNFATIMNCNVNICIFRWSLKTPVKPSETAQPKPLA